MVEVVHHAKPKPRSSHLPSWPTGPFLLNYSGQRKRVTIYNIYTQHFGIVNTMDLLEKLLPHIESHMGMKILCFGPYSYQQLQEIISSHLNGIEVVVAFGDSH
ncbi:hypothetical protein SUGI_0375500 [Cryptomeria japonica]|nr:hypothetical protein SUGI_0375500 [Cryptomeria japonica]